MSVGASCCGAATCTALCSNCGGKCQSSTATRIVYALLLAVNSIISWILLTPWAINKLRGLTLDYMKFKCGGGECYGFVAVSLFPSFTSIHNVNLAPDGKDRVLIWSRITGSSTMFRHGIISLCARDNVVGCQLY